MLTPLLAAYLVLSVDTETLLREMVDLDRLTREADYVTTQFSSYDRRSRTPADTDGWFANDDRGHYLRAEGGEFILAETEGPGAILRIWSANPAGVLRIRLDGQLALETDFRALLAGEHEAFPPPFGAVRARGGNLYYPFPFQERMTVSCTEGGQYFQVNVRSYPAGTAVETWSPGEAPALPALVAPVMGQPTTARRLSGPGVVQRLEVDLPDDDAALRAETLRIVVDGEVTVHAPLGDFFGTAPGRNAYLSLPFEIDASGVGTCRFPMPFAQSFEVECEREVRLFVSPDDGIERPYRFFAWWRGEPALATRPMTDWPLLHVEGEGRLVGSALTVSNPVKGWWGEGDEKIFVDGEPFPSTFGTGTEDYYGYAWCDTSLFSAPYHAQSRCDGPINRGHCSINRFHVLDDIPFRSSLRFDMEVWHWVDCTMAYATMAYWYARPGARHEFSGPTLEQRAIVTPPEIPRVVGAIEGESLRVVSKSAGITQAQDLGFSTGFSGESHLWWRDAKPGDTLRVAFSAPSAGRSNLVLRLTKAPDYGIVAIRLNDRLLDDRIDLWAESVVPDDERTYEGVPLKSGDNELLVSIVGTNPKANPKNYMFGIDYLLLGD